MQGHFLPSSLVGDATGVAIGRLSLTPCLSGTSIMAVGYMLDEVLMCGSRCVGGVTGCVRTRRGICIGFRCSTRSHWDQHIRVGTDMFILGSTCLNCVRGAPALCCAQVHKLAVMYPSVMSTLVEEGR